MLKLRHWLLIALLVLPVFFMLGVGGWAMYQAGYALWVWLLWPAAWLLALLLARFWKTPLLPLKAPDRKPADHWTERDEEAWQVVTRAIDEAATVPTEELVQMPAYLAVAERLAQEITRTYHPDSKDPVSSLTIPEILAAAELAVEDLAELFQKYVPAGHLMTIRNWKRLAKLPKQYDRVAPWTWALAAVFSPAATAGRYALSKAVLSPITQQLQANVLVWFYQRFVEKVGYYLIETNSGRLRGGAKLFRRHFKRHDPGSLRVNAPLVRSEGEADIAPDTPPPATPLAEPVTVTIGVVGQSGSGKTSLIEALLRNAGQDATSADERGVVRHAITLPETDVRLTLLDSRGYGGSASGSELASAEAVFAEADLVLLTMKATSPAREADKQLLEAVRAWFASKPDLKYPPVLGVLTQIDLLAPVMEWEPPYHWDEPSTRKEHAIHEALLYAVEVLGDTVSGVVPVCTALDNDRLYGVDEYLLPAMLTQMRQAKSVALVRGLESDLQEGQYRKLVDQFVAVGGRLLEAGLPFLRKK